MCYLGPFGQKRIFAVFPPKSCPGGSPFHALRACAIRSQKYEVFAKLWPKYQLGRNATAFSNKSSTTTLTVLCIQVSASDLFLVRDLQNKGPSRTNFSREIQWCHQNLNLAHRTPAIPNLHPLNAWKPPHSPPLVAIHNLTILLRLNFGGK